MSVKDVARLLAVTNESLDKGIEQAVVGNRVSDISKAIQEYVERPWFLRRQAVCWPWHRYCSA